MKEITFEKEEEKEENNENDELIEQLKLSEIR